MPNYIPMPRRPKGNVVQVYPTIPSPRVVFISEFLFHEQWDIPNIKTKILKSIGAHMNGALGVIRKQWIMEHYVKN